MKNIINSMLKHPIATVIILSSISHNVATVISAVKGNEIRPVVEIKTMNG